MTKHLVAWLLFWVWCLCDAWAQGEDFQFRHWNVGDGLSSSTVNCFLCSRQGYLWIGTDHGLNRYDGNRFKVYMSQALGQNDAWTLQEDATGDIWIASHITYARYDHAKDAIDSNVREYLHDRLGINVKGEYKVFVDRSGNLWVLDHEGVSNYSFASRKLTTQSLPELADIEIGFLSVADRGDSLALQLRYPARMMSLDKKSLKLSEIKISAAIMEAMQSRPCDIFADEYGGLWFYTLYGADIYRLPARDTEWQRIDLRAFHPSIVNSIRRVSSDGEGHLWIATDKCGLYCYDFADGKVANILKSDTKNNTLLSNNVNTVYCDNTGNIWLGYYKRGMSVTGDAVSQRFKVRYSQCGDASALLTDSRGGMWIGTDGNGLWHDDGRTMRHLLHANTVTALCEDKWGRIWAGTFYNGMYCIEGERITNYNKGNSALPDNAVNVLQPDRTGCIWIGMLNAGLSRLAFDSRGLVRIEPQLYDICGQSFAYNGGNDLYVATYYGIGHIDIASGHLDIMTGNRAGTQRFEKMDLSVLAIEPQARRLWISLSPRLSVLDFTTDSLYVLSTSDGLSDDMVNAIVPLGADNVLIATSKGLSNIAVSRDERGALHFNIDSYTRSIGIGNTHFNNHSTARMNDGNIMLGTPDGCVEVNTEALTAHKAYGNSKVRFTGLMIAGHEVRPDSMCEGRVITPTPIDQLETLCLRYNDRQVTFQFSSTEYISTSDIRYAYKIDGQQDTWLYTNESQITFNSFAPGEYTLRVCLADDIGGQSMATMRIEVAPPFYLSTPACIIYVVLIIAIVIAALLYIMNRQRRRLAEHQRQLEIQNREMMNETKLRFYTNVSHDLRTPITLILSPLQIMLRKNLDADMRHKLTVMERNAKQLLSLVNSLLDFRRIEKGVEMVKLTSEQLDDFIDQTCAPYIEYSKERGISFRFNADCNAIITSDFDKLKKIVNNLLSNAFKFTPEGGEITVHADRPTSDHFRITVADTGTGISYEDKKHIFERFFQSDNENTKFGSGIGLNIAGEYVKLLGGEITVEDNKPCGTIFTVSVPFKSSNSEAAATESCGMAAISSPTGQKNASGNAILLVDDNADILDFISDSLKADYRVFTASNGREALNIARSESIDIVVSDVMMPVMDGMDLCREIKGDIATSHIPVILLTAKSADEHKIEGLELGADDYISKPFDFDILRLRIRKFLEWRECSHQAFSRKTDVAPSEITITSLDEQLLTKAIKTVEENISDTDFSVEEIGRLLGLSRSHLYNKLMSLTGKGPADFIRTIRIKRGRQLLDSSGMQISEIAYTVGFSTPKRFSVNFKEEYGILPSEYIKNRGKKT